VIFSNYAKSAGTSLAAAGQGAAGEYVDAPSVASWAQAAVAECKAAGLLDGIASAGGAFAPQAPLTRAELADLMQRMAAAV